MQLKNKQAIYNKRKHFEKSYTKYRELDVKPITIKVIIGTIMHRCDITFRDGNKQSLVIHKVDNNLVLSQPKMWEYPMEKLAVLDYLTNIIFFNDVYTIIESKQLHKNSDQIKPYKVLGNITSSDSYIYAISTHSFDEEDFNDYDIRCKSKVAKNFKYPVKYVK